MADEPNTALGRRTVLGAGAGLIGWGTIAAKAIEDHPPAPEAADAIIVTLLGTGSPDLRMDRFGMSTLVQAGGLNLVFDAGRGCAMRLDQAGVALGKVDAVFITHFHSDHLTGLPDLWLTGYLPGPFGRRPQALSIHGPAGIARIADSLRATYADDIRIRVADEHVPLLHTEVTTHEFFADGPIFQRDGVTVTAFEVNHGPLVKPAYGYRIDFAGRSVLLSGDTRYDENLIAHGQDVDLLVHEVAIAPEPLMSAPWVPPVLDHHTTAEQAGTVFSRTRPKLAVFSHIVEISDPTHPRPGAAEIARRTRTTWQGPLLVGSDLDRLMVAQAGVTRQAFDPALGGYRD